MHYMSTLWKHALPSECRDSTLSSVAQILAPFGIVALQEVDGGSARTRFLDQTEVLADAAGFEYRYHQATRRLFGAACHGNALLSKFPAISVERIKLPAMIPGRGALVVQFGPELDDLVVINTHLSVGRFARRHQFRSLRELVRARSRAIVLGDFNCELGDPDFRRFVEDANLRIGNESRCTYPSWSPTLRYDHILVPQHTHTVPHRMKTDWRLSDHLPVAVRLCGREKFTGPPVPTQLGAAEQNAATV